MPSLHITVTSTSSDVSIPGKIPTKHLHLKYVSVRLDTVASDTILGMEIEVPFLKHSYQIQNNLTKRSNIVVPLSTDTKTTVTYSDLVFVGETIPEKFSVKLLNPSDGTTWTDGATIVKCVHLGFEYSKKDE
jgi:hypothetical protein